jgi:surfactin synthase thioesterase subunit
MTLSVCLRVSWVLQEWAGYTSSRCTSSGIAGNHLFPLQPAAKQQWLAQVAQALAETLDAALMMAEAPAGCC